MFLYTFYQPVFDATHDQHFPSESEEHAAFWVGFAEHCGDSLAHMVLDADTQKPSPEVLSGPGLSRIPIKGLLMLEGRKTISLIPKPLDIQLLLQMLVTQLSQIPQLSS